MHHVSDVLTKESFAVRRQAQETKRELDPLSVNVVNRLFAFFESICRGFEKQYQLQRKLDLEKIQWARGFMDSNINRIEQIEFGIKKCRLESPVYVPRLGEFLKWCTPSPEEMGLPSFHAAFNEAVANSHPVSEKKWSHAAVYHAWSLCNSYELLHSSKASSYPIFERNYDITVKMIIRGETLKEIPKAITYKENDQKKAIANGKGFEHCNSSQTAMETLRKILGAQHLGSAST